MSGPLVEARLEGDVCILRLCREEKLNALSTALEQALGEALDRPAVRDSACLVLTGSGRAFSAGADISEFADRDPEAIARYYRESGGVYERIAALPQPTISAIHGYCLGGGLELALATDFRVADETAVFGFPEVSIGILPSSGGTVRAARLLGPARAKQLILLGGRLTADEAVAARARDGARPGRRLARPRPRARKRARRAATTRRQHREAGDRRRRRSRHARRHF